MTVSRYLLFAAFFAAFLDCSSAGANMAFPREGPTPPSITATAKTSAQKASVDVTFASVSDDETILFTFGFPDAGDFDFAVRDSDEDETLMISSLTRKDAGAGRMTYEFSFENPDEGDVLRLRLDAVFTPAGGGDEQRIARDIVIENKDGDTMISVSTADPSKIAETKTETETEDGDEDDETEDEAEESQEPGE